MTHEEFMIRLQSEFIPSENVALLLEKVGNMVLEEKTEYLDDGVTHQIITRKGINLKERTELPPRIKLRPMRTFQEIEQPEAEFLLRISNDNKPKIALVESSGTAWQYEAIKLIAEYLGACLDNAVMVNTRIIA